MRIHQKLRESTAIFNDDYSVMGYIRGVSNEVRLPDSKYFDFRYR